MTTHPLFAAVTSLLLATTASAHDTWLSPSSYSAAVGQTITFDLTSGMEFPTLDAAIKPERMAKAGFRILAEAGRLTEFKPAEHALQVEQAFAREGVAIVWLQLSPKEIELSDDDVAHYLEEVRAPQEVQSAWAAQKGQQKWRELYTKCAKTCVAIGSPNDAPLWRQPVGMPLELVPLTDPTRCRAGGEAKFLLIRNREPLPNHAVALHVAADDGPKYATTDAEGVVTFQLDRAGPSMVATVHLRPPATGKPWESDFSTFTFEVKQE